jgi:phosphate transport system permease protein
LVSSVLALEISVPVGLGVAVCLSQDWGFVPKFTQTSLTFLIELLAAIPSVVYGLWGIFVLVPWLRSLLPNISSRGMLPAALVLAIMILPAIASISKNALLSLSPDLRLAAMSLGATRWECLLGVQIPAAGAGIIGAILLSLGRAMGETMAVTMLIGNANQIQFSIFAPASTIASLLANQYNEATGLQGAALMYASLILFGLTLLTNVLAEFLIAKISQPPSFHP